MITKHTKTHERALVRAIHKMNHLQGLIDRGHLDWFTNWRLNRVARRIQKLEAPMIIQKLEPPQYVDGGWRLCWVVYGPGNEAQKFCTKAEAKLYADIRINCQDEIQAIQEFWSSSRSGCWKPTAI
jgi:hypothetical protein